MRKNENPNSISVRPKGTPWKLGFFFLWVCILFSNPLLAVEEIHSGEIADSVRTDKNSKEEINVLHIQKGAFVYGMENITQTITPSSNVEQTIPKPLPKKKKAVVEKKESKRKAEPKYPKLKVSVVLSSHSSEESFSQSKKSFAVATITLNPILKSAVLANPDEVFTAPFPNTNSLYSYSLFILRDISGFRMFTRPPPSLF